MITTGRAGACAASERFSCRGAVADRNRICICICTEPHCTPTNGLMALAASTTAASGASAHLLVSAIGEHDE